MRAGLALLALTAAVAVALASLPFSADAARRSCARTKNVTLGDDRRGEPFFSRSKVTIRAGSCVRWIWTGQLEHELEGKGLNTPVRGAPYRFRKRYSRARRAPYGVVCTIHPLSMRMKVKVLPRRSS